MRTSKRMPGTGRRSDRSVIHRRICGRATAPPPDDAKSGQKKETVPWSALSTSVGPITRRPTATPARAGDPLTLLITRHARNSSGSSRQKRQPQQASQSQHTKWPPQQQPKRDTRYPTTLLQKRSHPAKTPDAPREEEPDKLMTNLASSWKKQTGERQWTPLQNRRDARRCTRPQEAERQRPPHPPVAHVWPAGPLPRPASGQEKQVIARMTASDWGERAIANERAAPPDRQGKRARSRWERQRAKDRDRAHRERSRRDRYRSEDRDQARRDREPPR